VTKKTAGAKYTKWKENFVILGMKGQTLPSEQARRWKNNAKNAASEASR